MPGQIAPAPGVQLARHSVRHPAALLGIEPFAEVPLQHPRHVTRREPGQKRLRGQLFQLLGASLAKRERVRDQFAARYRKLYPKAVETLSRDWERMVTFYRFSKRSLDPPAHHQSGAIAVLGGLRTDAARRYQKVANAEALIWKILMIAEKKFRRINSPQLLGAVHDGQLFQDAMPVQETNPKRCAA